MDGCFSYTEGCCMERFFIEQRDIEGYYMEGCFTEQCNTEVHLIVQASTHQRNFSSRRKQPNLTGVP